MDKDVNLSVLANLQGGLNESGDLLKAHNASLAENGTCSELLYLVDNFLT